MVCHEATKPRNNDTVVAQHEYLNMSFEFNHGAKLLLLFELTKEILVKK